MITVDTYSSDSIRQKSLYKGQLTILYFRFTVFGQKLN